MKAFLNHQELGFEADNEIGVYQMQISWMIGVTDPMHRERAYTVDAKYLRYSKCDNSIWHNMRHSLGGEFHNGVTLTAGEKSGLLSLPLTHNFFRVYEETVKEDTHTQRSPITNHNHIPNWLVTWPEVLR
jgi:hypothetical protein